MIVPFPEEILPFKKYTATWTLVALNVFIFVLIFAGRPDVYSKQWMLKPENLELTGRLYNEWKQTNNQRVPANHWSEKSNMMTSSSELQVLGAFALRQSSFLMEAADFAFKTGDEVRIIQWKKQLREFGEMYKQQSIYKFGLSAWSSSSLSWITYQFSHSNWIHLLSNMVFLVLIGVAIEALVGSLGLFVLYILGGIAGGLLFQIFSQHGVVPMIGASASISALMAFYVVAERRKSIRYFYFLMPIENFFGPIFLPTLLIIPLFLLGDISSILATPEGLGGGVAYSAHLGGSIWGVLTGMIFRILGAYPKASKLS